ncbi:bifunctional ADP-dependent NAD(P)H-hydrate dehydratase/NAD(P)H-hydrate epimerase [Castellaniella daejeonensis]|jgi:NAD(P)H-hydrate epimerase|uniref:Bifunctional NAD(P)H-hydrate repair enzyme n=1 Tax=Castellaniella daejeonensis TaxID=659013 RepID=A0ABN0TEF6_9BURK|nr:NAD(P)H-hydrate dehydratase [Castellaniella sp.]HET8702782.1 NAD(P)H-hydrate dehydratase [Castellaniella sp.]
MSEAYRCSDARAGRGARARLSPHALLSPQQMGSADRAAPAAGVPGVRLMEAAGAAVARAVQERWAPTRVLVLCGPGNNGGDGFVAARLLRDAGWPVRVALWGSRDALHGDAAWAADSWGGPVEPAVPGSLDGAGLIVDALLGAGLSRAPADELQALIDAVNAAAVPVCAIDVPTGLDGASGRCPGAAIRADLTVTFCRRKPGHLLLPGRALCGALACADIGMPDAALESIVPEAYANHPDLWSEAFPWPRSDGHKYHRGHVLAVGGERMTGASRLACLAAARIGAGLVTLAVPPAAWAIQAGALASVMVEALPPDGALARALADPRRNALLIGPGLGREPRGKSQVLELLASGRSCVLDADALSVFSGQPDALLQALHAQCVLTPHEGEFARLFGPVTDGAGGGKLRRARDAARRSGAVVVLKGADTVIAAPDGRCIINDNAPPTLATAGSGDVLAGCIVGLLAAGMPALEAACAAVWLHGLAADRLGWGLLAEDLPGALPGALAVLADMVRDSGEACSWRT